MESAVDRGSVVGMIPSHTDLYPKYSNLKYAVGPTNSAPLLLDEVNNQPKHACEENSNDSPIDSLNLHFDGAFLPNEGLSSIGGILRNYFDLPLLAYASKVIAASAMIIY